MIILLAFLLAQSFGKEAVSPVGRQTQNTVKIEGCNGQIGCIPINVSGTINASTSCKATAVAPTYTEASDNPLSCDLAGTLRTTAGSGGAGAASFSDGTTDRQARVKDTDTGAGTHYTAEVILQKSASGGPVDFGTSTDPLRTDPTGTTIQPVSAASLPLPTGAATEATLLNVKTGTDKIPASPSTDRTTAAGPFSTRLSDGAAFYDATKTGQLPAALDGSGFLKTHEQGTAAISAASLPLPTGAATSAAQTDGTQKAINRGGAKGATAAADITSTANGVDHQGLDVAVQGTVPVSGTVTTTPPSNASTNVTQLNGTTVDTNSGTKSAGTLRVVLATDQPQLTNKLLVTPDSVALPANQSVNVAQIAGSTTTTLAAGEQKVGVEGLAASGAAKSGNPVQVGGVFNTTQPTVTTGQAVEAQATARGELMIAKGVSGFSVDNTGFNVNNSPTVNQGGAPWSQNITQINGTTILTGNGVTGAGSVRVTIASDNTAFTVNAAQSGTWNINNISGTISLPTGAATDRTTAAGPFSIRLSDGAAFYDARSIRLLTSSDTVTVVQGTGTNLHVVCDSGCTPGGSFADNTAFTAGSTAINIGGGEFNDTPLADVTSGNAAASRITKQRAVHVNLRDALGNEITSLGGGGAGTTVFTGQQALTPYAAAQQLPTNSAKTVCVRNLPRSADVVWLGNSATVNADNGTPIYPGEENCDALTNSSAIYAFTMAGATVAVRGTN